jgi:hypothetical protein
MTLDDVLTAHREWKTKFRVAMAKGEKLDVEQIASDAHCQFGTWLHTAAKAACGHLPEFRHCVEVHAAFHRECGKIAEVLNSGRLMDAERMLGFDTPYSETSNRLSMAVTAMFHAGRCKSIR